MYMFRLDRRKPLSENMHSSELPCSSRVKIFSVSTNDWAYRDVLPKWVSLSPKILRQKYHFSRKIFRWGSRFTEFVKRKKKRKKKIIKSDLRIGSRFEKKFKKKEKRRQISLFLREKKP